MNLWTTRESALQALRTDLARECELLDRAFQQLEYFAQRLGDFRPETPFTRITALVAVKARNLAQASYSLVLDGLGQESGAIVRVWLEANELLGYIRRDPERTSQIVEGNLPKAGARAKLIDSAPYGKHPDELARVLGHIDMVEPLLRKRATHEIDTSVPVDQVVATVLRLIESPRGDG